MYYSKGLHNWCVRLNNRTANPPYKEINECLWSKFLEDGHVLFVMKSWIRHWQITLKPCLITLCQKYCLVWVGSRPFTQELECCTESKAYVPYLSIGTSWLTAAFLISHYFWMFTLKVWAQVPIRQWNCQLATTRVCNTTCYIMKHVEITQYVTQEYATAQIHRWA